MTYSAGSKIVATDYNGFANATVGANVNATWGTGTTDAGYGQSTTLTTVSSGGVVSALQWANLNNRIISMASHQGTTITARTSPVTGNLIQVLANVNTDITNCYAKRGNAVSVGTTSTSWTGAIAKTAATTSGTAAWNITFTHTITFPSADQARYFWNAGGLVRMDMSKTSTGTDSDPDWNTFIGTVGTWYLTGRVNGAAQTIAGTSYTGFTRVGGSGTPSPNLTTTGWYSLTPSTATSMMTLTSTTAPYTGDYVNITMTKGASSNTLTIVTVWHSNARAGAGESTSISGGTDTASPYSAFGTAPAVLVRLVFPETTYLTNTWGTPTIAASAV